MAKARIALHLGTAYNALAAVTDRFYLLPENVPAYVWFHLGSLAAVALWWLLLRRLRLPLGAFVYPLQVATVAFFAWRLHLSLVHESGLEPLFNGAALLGITTLLLPICPYNDWRVPATAGVFTAIHVVAWGGLHEQSVRWLAIALFALASSLFFHYYHLLQIRREALYEYEARKKILSQAKLKMEHELELARDIQDSLAPPPERHMAGNVRVHCLQVKNDQVGGDWMALRALDDRRLVAVVADATGKGIGAALVVHALQSLWADELHYETFDPEKWIQRVNRTLLRLGEKKPHSLTLGVVLLTPEAVTYWSAGHVPAFLVLGEDGPDAEVRPLAARGPMLGVARDVQLQPVTVAVPADKRSTLLLATDGVMERGSRSSRRDVLDLLTALRLGGRDALEARAGEDDKTLVWLERKAG